MRIKYLVKLLLLVLCTVGSAQNETKKWYFGNGTGLDFSTTPPSTISVSSMTTPEGCASIADAGGNLLFYTNGVTIWDKTHSVMSNGNGLTGHVSTSQSALILPMPGSSNLYYVFTNVGNNLPTGPNVNYSVVDMNLSAGNGSVITKNTALSPDPSTEMLSATRHCNGVDWWIVVHIRNSSTFLAFILSSTGINMNYIPSTIGPNLLSGFSQMKFSPNGRKIAVSYQGAVYVGDFDDATGIISSFAAIQTSSGGYGCEFSPDGRMLYAATNNSIKQYNLCAGNPSAIANSATIIHSQSTQFGSFQLAPDGKIYVVYNSVSSSCHVINNPNVSGVSCNFSANAVFFNPKSATLGLPNFPGCYFYNKAPPNPFFVSISPSYGCYGAYFDATVLSSTCSAITNSLSGVAWDFGDPLSGPNNTSYLNGLPHNFSGNGTYTVTLYLYYLCNYPADTLRQVVVINDNCLSYNSTTVSCGSLGSATINASAGIGPFTYTWMPGGQTGTIAAGLIPGAHTVVVNDLTANYTYSVPIFLAPAISLSANISMVSPPTCFGGSNGAGSISGIAGGSPSQSFFWTNGVQTTTVQNPVNLTTGIWTVTVTDLLSACKVVSVLPLSQPQPVAPIITPSSYTACYGGVISLSCTGAGGTPAYSYTWTNGPVASTRTVSEAVPGVYIYSVMVNDANACAGSQSISLSFINGPPLSASNTSICPQQSGILFALGATNFTWMIPGSGSTIGPSLAVSPSVNTQYTVIGESSGCTSTVTTSVFLYSFPSPTLQSNSPICDGGTILLNVNGGASYQWLGPAGLNVTSASVAVNGAGPGQAGTYTVITTSSNSCTVNNTINVSVNPLPTVTVAGSTVCTTQTINLFANSAPGNTYWWSGPNGFSSTQQNPSIPYPSLNQGGTYYVAATSAFGCVKSASTNVQVISPPSISLALSSATICAQALNGSVNMLSVTPSGANAFTLMVPASLNMAAYGTMTTVNQIAPFSNTVTAVTMSLEGTNGLCSSKSTYSFSIIPNPTISIVSSSAAICIGESFTMVASGATTYSWTGNLLSYSISGNGSILTAQPANSASFSLIGENMSCRSATENESILVKPLPVFTLTPYSPSICLNSEITIKALGIGNSYQWYPSTGLNTTTGPIVKAKPLSDQQYKVIAILNGCLNSDSVMVTVYPLPVAKITAVKNKVCLHDSVVLFGAGGVFYDWKGPGGVFYQGQRVRFETFEAGQPQNYFLTVTDLNGCKSGTAISIEILPNPDGTLENFKESVCAPYCANYVFDSFGGDWQTSWEINSVPVATDDFSYCYNAPGSFTLRGKITDPNTGCRNIVNYSLTVYEKPVADFHFSPQKPIMDLDDVLFTDASTGSEISSWTWYFSDNKGYSTKGQHASLVFSEVGTYPVVLVTGNKYGCKDTVVKVVSVEPDFSIYVPNAFTPNEDQLNDLFLPVVRNAKNYNLEIYDRWGQLIFNTTDYKQGWDGAYRGEPCKQDVYNYVIKVTTAVGESKYLQGTVALIRGI